MAGKKNDIEHEVGGFNPERREEKPKVQVGPPPTDDPRHKSTPDVADKIKEGLTKLPPG